MSQESARGASEGASSFGSFSLGDSVTTLDLAASPQSNGYDENRGENNNPFYASPTRPSSFVFANSTKSAMQSLNDILDDDGLNDTMHTRDLKKIISSLYEEPVDSIKNKTALSISPSPLRDTIASPVHDDDANNNVRKAAELIADMSEMDDDDDYDDDDDSENSPFHLFKHEDKFEEMNAGKKSDDNTKPGSSASSSSSSLVAVVERRIATANLRKRLAAGVLVLTSSDQFAALDFFSKEGSFASVSTINNFVERQEDEEDQEEEPVPPPPLSARMSKNRSLAAALLDSDGDGDDDDEQQNTSTTPNTPFFRRHVVTSSTHDQKQQSTTTRAARSVSTDRDNNATLPTTALLLIESEASAQLYASESSARVVNESSAFTSFEMLHGIFYETAETIFTSMFRSLESQESAVRDSIEQHYVEMGEFMFHQNFFTVQQQSSSSTSFFRRKFVRAMEQAAVDSSSRGSSVSSASTGRPSTVGAAVGLKPLTAEMLLHARSADDVVSSASASTMKHQTSNDINNHLASSQSTPAFVAAPPATARTTSATPKLKPGGTWKP